MPDLVEVLGVAPIGLHNVHVIMSVTLLLVLVAAMANALLLKQDRRLRNPGGSPYQEPG
jgi:hypothetical protein